MVILSLSRFFFNISIYTSTWSWKTHWNMLQSFWKRIHGVFSGIYYDSRKVIGQRGVRKNTLFGHPWKLPSRFHLSSSHKSRFSGKKYATFTIVIHQTSPAKETHFPPCHAMIKLKASNIFFVKSLVTPPKTNMVHLKMDPWKRTFLLVSPSFPGSMLTFRGVPVIFLFQYGHLGLHHSNFSHFHLAVVAQVGK